MANSWKLNPAVQATLSKAVNALENEVSHLNSRFDEHSEKWQDSDTGQEIRTWIDDLEELAANLDNIEPAP